ncbi:MAG: hypothetical protein LPH21_18970 [Shewanella sp.]|nr:hypothetical protein [Shewanella sp.]
MTPAIIHYLWLGKLISDDQINYMYKNVLSKAPTFEVYLWTDRPLALSVHLENSCRIRVRDIREVINKFDSIHASVILREIYGCYKNYAAASDVLRLALLYHYGGLYLDVDSVLVRNIGVSDIQCAEGIRVYGWFPSSHQMAICNGAIAARKEHPTLKMMLIKIVYNYYGKNAAKCWSDKRSNKKMRVQYTVCFSGSGIISELIDMKYVFKFFQLGIFGDVVANTLSWNQPYKQNLKRSNSVPALHCYR